MPAETEFDVRVTVPVKRATRERLHALAAREELTVADLIRRAVRRLLAEEDEHREEPEL